MSRKVQTETSRQWSSPHWNKSLQRGIKYKLISTKTSSRSGCTIPDRREEEYQRKSRLSQRAAGCSRLVFPPGVRHAYGETPDISDPDGRHFPNQNPLTFLCALSVSQREEEKRKAQDWIGAAERKAERLAAVCPHTLTHSCVSVLSLLTSAWFLYCQCSNHASFSSLHGFMFLPPILSSLFALLPFFFFSNPYSKSGKALTAWELTSPSCVSVLSSCKKKTPKTNKKTKQDGSSYKHHRSLIPLGSHIHTHSPHQIIR